MAQADRNFPSSRDVADPIWSDLGEVGAAEMLDHVRRDNQALDSLRLALEHDMSGERSVTTAREFGK
ncbi:hypothetical protein ACP4J4_10855 [Aureimonas ureilytica]|uniref:hypothetical protein n=1 Tax=Aureimonas ureilytica TaxID=401562 RepID=UPI003CF81283